MKKTRCPKCYRTSMLIQDCGSHIEWDFCAFCDKYFDARINKRKGVPVEIELSRSHVKVKK